MSKMNQFISESVKAFPIALCSCLFSLLLLSFSGIFNSFSLKDIFIAFLLTVLLVTQFVRPVLNIFDQRKDLL